MAKMSFEEFMKAREEYAAYLNGEQPETAPAPAEKPEPAAEPEPAPADPAEDPEKEEMKNELQEIRQQLAIMAKALSPSLGDIQPVGVDDVVKKFFSE